MGLRMRGYECPQCHKTGYPQFPCSCGAPAVYDKDCNQRAWFVWCGTWWKPWTWLRMGWIEFD